MRLKDGERYSDKHGRDAQIDETLAGEVRRRAPDGKLPCAVAFDIARAAGCTPAEVGRTADLLDFRLVKCQLGLFGYQPQKKIVKPSPPAAPQLAEDLRQAAGGGALSCEKAWELAERHGVAKMSVSAACEELGIKVKPCQLGAF